MITLKQELTYQEMLAMDRAEAREELFEDRHNWLEALGCKSTDVLTDEDGEEYILSDEDGGDTFSSHVVYLPLHLQTREITLNF